MVDPYQVLGIPQSATDDEIKAAYRQLARKYHPDNYVDNPLADLATEKMKEINDAYDEIQRRRRGGGQGAASQSYGGQSYSGQSYCQQTASQFDDIRRMIQNGRLLEAEELLEGGPQPRRDGEWNYLMGSIYYSKGWLDTAINYYVAACRLSPNNLEYRGAYQRLMQQRQYGAYPSAEASCCQTCATIYCCSSCCNCMGSGC